MVYVHKPRAPEIVTSEQTLDGDGKLTPKAPPLVSEFPVFGSGEQLLMGLLRPPLEERGVTVATEHYEGISLPLVLARTTRASSTTGIYPRDVRFYRSLKVSISTFAEGVEAEASAGYLAEAVQQILLNAWRQQVVVPGAGSISEIRAWIEPMRVSDFQTATNIVQYPSLPKGTVRYEQNLNITIRPDSGHTNPFLA